MRRSKRSRRGYKPSGAAGVAFLMLNSELLKERRPDGTHTAPPDADLLSTVLAPNVATHFAALREHGPNHPVNVTHSGRVRFDCFTWGGYRTIDVSRDTFDRHMFLVIAGRP